MPDRARVEPIFETAPFRQCHASTLAATPAGLVAAWFAGTREKHADVGIWLARHDGRRWTAPVEVADGVEGAERHPCWNPVLWREPAGALLLFYKVGPSPRTWWGVMKESRDDGATWSPARRLPEGVLGPIKNKPIALPDGSLLCPSSTEDRGWRAHFERTRDAGRSWEAGAPVADPRRLGAIQPCVLTHPGGRLQALCRSPARRIVETWSGDGGKTWTPLEPTSLPNPNSGIDAVTLADGRHLLVYNDTSRGRSPLNVAVSGDGAEWRSAFALERERGEFSYPAVVQAPDGTVHATYTARRRHIAHAAFPPPC